MEEADDLAGLKMPSSYVRAFMPVAVETRKREVVRGSRTTVLARNDMVDVKRQRISRRWQMAVFATVARSLPNVPRQIGIHGLSAAQGKPGFGLDHSEQVSDMQIAVEFGALFVG